uniref:Uncharacterized protein n=1 Tax=Oryza punctata TaxID=4537 RepID=A0A0E0M5L6_ORYPU
MYPIPWSIVLPSGRPELRRRRVLAAACIASAASLRAAGERTAANMNKNSTNACAPPVDAIYGRLSCTYVYSYVFF